MSSKKEFERELAIHTAPAMLGAKPANLLTMEGAGGVIGSHIARFNARAGAKGLHIKELKRLDGRTLMLLYNERVLNERLGEDEVRSMLCGFGYGGCESCPQYLERLRSRMEEGGDFPHEVGLFLGYPVEDIRGFIDNKGRNFLICGYWKVYCNAENARRTFERYNKCKRYMINCLDSGKDIYSALRIN